MSIRELLRRQTAPKDREAVVDMLCEWEGLVPPTPYDGDAGGPQNLLARDLRLAYRRGYGEALRNVRAAVERGAHRRDPNDQRTAASPS